ncbi:MAG: DUF4836 family protein [Sphingobacteriales bacterium]
MKKKGIIIGTILVIVIGAAAYFLLPFLSGKDLSIYIPKNAVFAMKMDLAQLGGKIDVKEIQDLKFFKKEIMGQLKSSEKDMMESVMQNPLKSGIQFRTAPIFFIFDQSDNEPVAVFMFGIADAKYFKTFISDLSKDISVKDPSNDEFYEVSNDDDEKVKIFFNDDVAMVLADLDNKDISLKKVRDKLIGLEKENSILSNELFTSLNSQKNDVMAFLNKKELTKVMENQNASGLGESELLGLSYLPTGMALNFNVDAISLKAYTTDKSGNTNMLKESGISVDELKNIAAKGNPFAFMTINIDPVKMIDAAVEMAELNNNTSKEEFLQSADQIASTFNTDREGLFKLFSGKMSIAYSGIVEQPKVDLFTLEETMSKAPKIYFWAKLGNKQLANSMIEKMVEAGEATETEGLYALNENSYSPTVYLGLKGDDLFVSTDLNGIKGKIKNDSWEALVDGSAKTLATSNPVSAFVDLNYKNYQDLMEASMGESEIEIFDKLKKNVLSAFKNISISSTDKESELVLQMSEEKKNSLQRLILIIDEAYKIAN